MTADELKALAERLRKHANGYEGISHILEYVQWAKDLRAAAQIIEQIAEAEPVGWRGINPRSGEVLTCGPERPAPSVMRDFRMAPIYLHPPAPADQTADQTAEIERLRAEVEALRSDAGRLHWLEQQSGHCGISVRDHDGTVLYGAGISDAIDAARAAQACDQTEGGR